MYQLLFVIHGMGAGERPANDPDWWTDLVKSLRGYAKPYGHDSDFVLSSPNAGQILVVPLTYHQLFDDIRKKWEAESGNDIGWMPLLKNLAFSDPAVLTKMPSWLQTAGTFFWTHVLDVLLYRYVSDFTTPIRDEVALQVATAWHKADLDTGVSTPVHFLAHSLGTSVLHDSIGVLASDPAFGAGTHRISSFITLANVSSVLETNFPAYESVDRTVNCAPPPDGMTTGYFSFRHEIDPIAAVKDFDGSAHGWPASDYVGTVVKDVKDWNVHGYTHYLDNPAANFRLLERLWPAEPWASRRPAADATYKNAAGTPCPQAIANARVQLQSILSKARGQTAVDLIDVVAETVKILQDARTACDLEHK